MIRRQQHVGGGADVLDGQRFVDVPGTILAGPHQPADRLVVLAPAGDRLLEDRRVRRHARDPVVADQAFDGPVFEPPAADEVEPDGLTEIGQCMQRIGSVHGDLLEQTGENPIIFVA
ncbi:MAG: hypothetical protein R2862_08885 [Thermoanaerobaculia bacterium]